MSKWTDEEIAQAAGLEWPMERRYSAKDEFLCDYCPSWYENPGACATWLLPVLERRFDSLSFDFGGYEPDARWSVSHVDDAIAFAPTWHECVIAGIMASAEGKA